MRRLWKRVGVGAGGTLALSYYRRLLTPELRALVPERLRRLAKRGFQIFSISDPITHVYELRLRLNELGFVERALNDLGRLSESADAIERQLAAWELAVWHANKKSTEGFAAALASLGDGIDDVANEDLHRREAVLRAECYAGLGDIKAAHAVVDAALRIKPHPDLYLAAANLCKDSDGRLMHINKAMSFYELADLSLGIKEGPSIYDQIVVNEAIPMATGPKVSVIVPAFNAAQHVATAIKSLIGQTWKNLEVLVVDDLSTDSTADVVESFSERDSRIRLIRAEANRGSYVARNLALAEASGEFVTTHDSDDWSHPQKIEIQARHLMRDPRVAANVSQQARTTSDLFFHRRGNPGFYIFDNMSSLMFRREAVAQKLGFWDSVRFGADSEFIERLRLMFGRRAVASLPALLSFQRHSESSLTGNGAFGYHGFLMGARQAYHEASRRYHRDSKRLFYSDSPSRRPFAVPEPMWPIREATKGKRRSFDVILISDFRVPGEFKERNLKHLESEIRGGYRVGLIQMADYGLDATAQVLPAFRDLEDAGGAQFIVYGERVSCQRLVVLDPVVLEEFQRFMPDVDPEQVNVIVEKTPAHLTGPEALREWLHKCRANAQRYFETPGEWSSEDPSLQSLLSSVRCGQTAE